jgi:AcrR family transcriptional regulator
MPAQPDSPKYADLLRTAKRLFWKHGIRRVSIEEICREAGVSKMTFYRFFPNKVELAKALLEDIFDESMQEYRALMEQDIPFEEKVRRQLLMKFENTEAMSAEFISDIYSNQEWGLGAYMAQRTEEAIQAIMTDYAHAQRMGWVRQDLNLNFMLYLLHQMPAWISDERLAASYDDIHDLIMEIANFFFYGVLPHSTESNE